MLCLGIKQVLMPSPAQYKSWFEKTWQGSATELILNDLETHCHPQAKKAQLLIRWFLLIEWNPFCHGLNYWVAMEYLWIFQLLRSLNLPTNKGQGTDGTAICGNAFIRGESNQAALKFWRCWTVCSVMRSTLHKQHTWAIEYHIPVLFVSLISFTSVFYCIPQCF